MIEIIVPTSNYDELKRFYKEKLLFVEVDDELLIPNHEKVPVRIHLQEESDANCLSYFRYEIEKNFLSYCDILIRNDVSFDMIALDPGGHYFARFFDSDGNKLEVVCNSLDEDNKHIDPSEWGCYLGY